ncbi:MAG: PAS domain-containing protein [Sphingobacteriia bacterium]
MTESLATRYTVGGHEGPVNESALKRQVEALTAQLQEAKEALKLQQQETESQQWLDKCLGRFDEVMRTHFDRGLRDYMEAILLEISKMIPLVQAALYVPDEQENNETPTIKLAAGYACNIDRLEKKCYMLGEGMIGQVAKSRKPYVLENLGKHAPIMQGSSLVQLIPQSLAVYPITYNEDLKGILELCCIQPPQARQLELLERLCRNLGASLESQLNQQKMKRLYRQSQEAYQQLAAQEEEMRQNLEELQATQEEMRRIEVEMKRQGESLNRTMQNVPGIVYSFQLEIAEQRQGFLYMSKQVEHILGFTAKTVLEDYGKNQTVQIHPDDVADHDRKMLESLRQQTKFVWEGRMQHRDGHWVYLRAESTPYGDESDANRMIWDGILLDIRDQKR